MACASMAVPAWVRIWLRVNCDISAAMSVSRIRDSDADRFSMATLRLLMRCSRRFCAAPRAARWLAMPLMAASMVVSAPAAFGSHVDRLLAPPTFALVRAPTVTLRVSPLLPPT